METNFIKERTVVRQDLIKKNSIQQQKKIAANKSGCSTSSSSKDLLETPHERVVVFEELVNEGLRQELLIISQGVDRICETIADYLKIKSAVKIFKSNPRDVRVQTNIGCNFYAQCNIPDASKIYVCVGQDYYLHMDLDEALKIIEFKEKQWTKQLDLLQERAAKIKAYIKIALEAMGRLYEIDSEKLKVIDE